jgi:hypothetical protein
MIATGAEAGSRGRGPPLKPSCSRPLMLRRSLPGAQPCCRPGSPRGGGSR